MGKELRKYHKLVELALKIIEEEEISWLDAINKAKEMLKIKSNGKSS